MAFNIDYPRKFTDLQQVYSHLFRLTETLNAQLNSMEAEQTRNAGLLDEKQQQTQQQEEQLKSKMATAARRAKVFNLLDNAYFLRPVNQRGELSYNEQGYTIDRWRTVADVTLKVEENGVKATGEFFQPIEKAGLVGQTLTAAVMLSNGEIVSGSGVVPAGNEWNNFIITKQGGVEVRVSSANEDTIRFRIFPGSGTVVWAALYRGAYNREALPSFTPRKHAEDLLECQRYFYRLPLFRQAVHCVSAGTRVGLSLPTEMRITPTLTVVEKGVIHCNGTSNVAVTAVTLNKVEGSRALIFTEHATQSTFVGRAGIWQDGIIEFSADL